MDLYKILIVEDDVDWQEDISGALNDAGYGTEVADSEKGALQKLKEEDFDLVILDLRIPYDADYEATMETGIEALKEIRGTSPGIPIITVSAFGSMEPQTVADSVVEGASLFIEKGKMSSELLKNKVAQILEKNLESLIIDKYPTPIAYIYREIKGGMASLKKFIRLMNLFEIFLKFSTIILICDYFESIKKDESIHTEFKESIVRPALGDWFNIINLLLKIRGDLREGILGEKILNFFTKKSRKMIAELIEVRNTNIGHGAQQSDYEYEKLAAEAELLMRNLLGGVKFLTDFRLCSVSSLTKKRDIYKHKIKECIGHNTNFILIEKDLKNVLPCNEMLLYHEKKENFLNLHPFIILENCDICKREEIFFYSKLQRDKLYYLNYETGHTISSNSYIDDFKELVSI
jgi:CheY-like chemotaxis protein